MGAPSIASVGAPSVFGAWGAEGAGVRGAEVLGAGGALGTAVLGGGALGVEPPAGALGGGCAGFCVGRGNGCGVCAATAVANNKLSTKTVKLRSTELL